MDTLAQISRARLGRLKLIGILLSISFVVLIAGSVIFVYCYSASRHAAFNRVAEQLRRDGVPTTPTELDRFYHDDENADRLGNEFMQAFAKYDAGNETVDDIPYFDRLADAGERPSVEDLKYMRAHLEANRDYLGTLRHLVESSQDVRFPMDFSQEFKMKFPHLVPIRNAVRMMAIQTQVLAEAGDSDELEATLKDSVLLAETLKKDPVFAPHHTRVAAHTIVHDEMEYAVNTVVLGENRVARLNDLLRTVQLDGMTAYALIGERCMSDLNKLGWRWPGLHHRANDLLFRFSPRCGNVARRMWAANMFLTRTNVIRIGNLPPWERAAAVERLRDEIDGKAGILHDFDRIMTPATALHYVYENRAIANLDTTIVALSVLTFARRTQDYPESLAALVPEFIESVPLDPFDGHPLRYRRTDTGFVVYSIGHDLDDDGGNPPTKGGKNLRDCDIVFRVLDARPYLSGE